MIHFNQKYDKMNYLTMILLIYMFLMFHQAALSKESVPYQRVIIDTDCAIDDFHAISFLLSQPEIEISAIIVSEGTLKPEDGVVKINSLLKEWNIDTIPVICHSSPISNIPPW